MTQELRGGRITLEERIARAYKRQAELESPLHDLANRAKAVYELLMPRAVYVGGSHPDQPVVWQSVNAFNGAAVSEEDQIGHEISRYLIVRLMDEGTSMQLHRDLGVGSERAFLWEFKRWAPLEACETRRRTRVTETDETCLENTGVSPYDLEVTRESHPHGYHEGWDCNASNGYDGAETAIADFNADLDKAAQW